MTTDKMTDARKNAHATIDAIRMRAIEATKAPMIATDLVQAHGVRCRTVYRWQAAYYKCDEQGHKAKLFSDRPYNLGKPQMHFMTLIFSSIAAVKCLF